MSIETALVNELTVKTNAVKALISTRLYPESAPQDVSKPYVVYRRVSTPPEYSHSGQTTLQHPRFQLTVVASSYSSARSVADAIRALLSAKTGLIGDNSVRLGGCFFENETTTWDNETELFQVMIDIIPYYTPS